MILPFLNYQKKKRSSFGIKLLPKTIPVHKSAPDSVSMTVTEARAPWPVVHRAADPKWPNEANRKTGHRVIDGLRSAKLPNCQIEIAQVLVAKCDWFSRGENLTLGGVNKPTSEVTSLPVATIGTKLAAVARSYFNKLATSPRAPWPPYLKSTGKTGKTAKTGIKLPKGHFLPSASR